MSYILLYIICGIYVTDRIVGIVSWTLPGLATVMCVLFLALCVVHHYRALLAFPVAVALFSLVFGSAIYIIRYDGVRHAVPMDVESVCGEVVETPKKKTRTEAVKIRTDRGAVVLCYLASADSLEIGDSIRAATPYGLSPTCVLDNQDTVLAGYYSYLFYQGVSATCYVPEGAWRLTGRGGSGVYSRLRSLQNQISDRYDSAGFTGDEGAVIRAMTVGGQQGMSKQLRLQFSSAGVSHVLALSGFHLSVIYMILDFFVLSVFVSVWWRRTATLLAIACITAYVMMAGAPPSLVRAAVMYSIMLLTRMFYRTVMSLDSLVFSATVMLIVDPLLLFSVSFQLSFLSMFGLITVSRVVYGMMKTRNIILRKILSSVSSTVICSVFTFPLVGYYFGIIPTLSVVSNLLVCLLATALMFIAAAWWLCFFSATLQSCLGWLLMSVSSLITFITEHIASVDWATIEWRPDRLGVFLCYASLVVVWQLLRRVNPRVA